jgi:hypothetical protein
MKALALLLGGLSFTATGSAGSVTLTGAEQQVGLGIGYKADDADHPLIEQLYPVPPQGLGDAELNFSRVYADYSVSASGSLTSSFEPNKVTVNGLATASNTWLNPPSGTLDIHAGSGAIFHLYLSTGTSTTNLHITGGVSFRGLLGMLGSIMWHPEDNYAYVRLSVAGGPIVWETRVNGSDIQASKLIEQDLQLAAGQNYVLEAFAMTGTCNKWHSKGEYSPEASFHFTATADASVSPDSGPGGSSPRDTNDLAGSWYIHSLASGPGAPWWEYGHVAVGADHSFSGVVQEYKKDPCEVSGRFLLAPNGVATFVGAAHDPDVVVFPHLHMVANKSMIAGVATWSAGFPGTTQMIVLTRRGASYQIPDLVGTWYVHSLASGPGAPWWEHGSLAVSADGSFTAAVQQYKSEPGTISGQFQIDPNGVVTIESVPDFTIGHMSSDKNMIAMVGTWATGSPGTTELKILTRKVEV